MDGCHVPIFRCLLIAVLARACPTTPPPTVQRPARLPDPLAGGSSIGCRPATQARIPARSDTIFAHFAIRRAYIVSGKNNNASCYRLLSQPY